MPTPFDQGPNQEFNENNSNPNSDYSKPNKKFSFGKIISFFIIIASLTFLAFGGYYAYRLVQEQNKIFIPDKDYVTTEASDCPLWNPACWSQPKTTKLKGYDEGRTNFLVLGIDEAAGLSDSIILASYYHQSKKIVTVNIPRDFYVYNKGTYNKINSIYPLAYAQSGNNTATAVKELSTFLSEEFEVDIHYWMTANFMAVKEVIDEMGGVDIYVDKPFSDCLYPTDGYKVVNGSSYLRPCPSFKEGKQKMDGKTALIYARSRETTSDFDRSRRQSVVIQAMLEKAKNQNLFESMTKIDGFLEILGTNFKSNFSGLSEMFEWYNLIKQSDLSTDFLRVIWEDGNGFLCSSSSAETGYIIKYCGGAIAGRNVASPSRTKAKNNIQNLLDVAESKTLFEAEVAILGNSSTEASKIRDELKELGFANIKFNNLNKDIVKATKNIETKTTIYIADTALRSKFAKLKIESEHTLATSLPTSKELPKGYETAKIAVWIENME